jgi:hypothetical protein
MTPSELRRKIVGEGFRRLKQMYSEDKVPEYITDFDKLIMRIIDINTDVSKSIAPVIKSGGGRDVEAMEQLLMSLFLQNSTSFTKDELQQIFAWQMTSTAMVNLYPQRLGVAPRLPDNSNTPNIE